MAKLTQEEVEDYNTSVDELTKRIDLNSKEEERKIRIKGKKEDKTSEEIDREVKIHFEAKKKDHPVNE
jgi:hypothetical protein